MLVALDQPVHHGDETTSASDGHHRGLGSAARLGYHEIFPRISELCQGSAVIAVDDVPKGNEDEPSLSKALPSRSHDGLASGGLASGRLSFSTDVTGSAVGADVALIAVGTLDGTGRWTDAHVAAVVSQLLAAPSVPRAIVVRSTLRPGRMAGLNGLVERSGHDTVLLIHPEFTKEGSAVRDFLAPDRIVVGKPADAPDTVADPVLKLYATTDAPTLAEIVGQREIFDTRAIIDADAAVKAGFRVRSLECRTLLPRPFPVRPRAEAEARGPAARPIRPMLSVSPR